MEFEISVDKAKHDKLHYVVSNYVVVNKQDRTVLLLKRGPHETAFANMWAFPGGKLEHSNIKKMIQEEGVNPLEGVDNVLGKLAIRETKEESGLAVNSDPNAIIRNKVFVRPDGVPVLMVSMAAEYKGGEVMLEKGFVDFAWVTEEELPEYDCIPGLEDEIHAAIKVICDI